MARRWLVIGGGPCGIATVGKLIDAKQAVTWVDPLFQGGRMGTFYRRVPANTLNGDLLVATRLCESFKFDHYQHSRKEKGHVIMRDLDENQCFALGYFVDSLDDMTAELLPKVNAIRGKVLSLKKTVNHSTMEWNYEVQDTKNGFTTQGTADAVINTCGSRPRPLPNLPLIDEAQPYQPIAHLNNAYLHSLDLMVDPIECQRISRQFPSTDRWSVIGDSHSGMLVVKNLVEGGVQNISNFHRSPLKFMYTTPAGCKK
jgi:cation diffusion facilitator CzcD-associated flavoprotein CzcO